MILSILGMIDLIGAGLLWFGGLAGSGWLAGFAAFFIIKGIWSVLSAGARGFWFDVFGWADVIAGVLLGFAWVGLSFELTSWFAIIMAAKGVWSLLMGLV